MANSKYDQVNGEILDYTISKMQTLIDAKADSSELETHADDTTAHITAAERTAWNAKQDALTFDSTPTSGSTKPVTSGGVYTALSNKQNTLSFDSTPTSGSSNPVTSGGVYTALSSKADTSEVETVQDNLDDHEADSTVHITAAERTAWNAKEAGGAAATALTDAKKYTDTAISNLINSAPSTLDTLGEITTAMEENADIVEALEEAIGTKADASELETHIDDTTAHITAAERSTWNAKQDALTFDSTPTSGSTKPVTSGGVYTALSNKQDTLTFDSAPTSGSANPVTSGGVYTALSTKADSSELDAKQDALTFDTTPTSDSSNPVTSGGVYDYANSLGTHIVATGGTGAAYTATVPGITALTAGVGFIMVTNVVSTSTTPTLDVNSLGAKTIKRRISTLGSQVASGYSAAWLTASKAYHVVYDGTYWIVENMTQAAAADLYGTVSMIKGGTGVTTLADTTYTTARYRGSALYSSDTAPTVNGVINWTYA